MSLARRSWRIVGTLAGRSSAHTYRRNGCTMMTAEEHATWRQQQYAERIERAKRDGIYCRVNAKRIGPWVTHNGFGRCASCGKPTG